MTDNPEPIQALSERAIFSALTAYGYSNPKAWEVVLDFQRGVEWARKWVDYVCSTEAGRAAIAEIEGKRG